MSMIKCHDQFDLLGQQHTVAEHIARHIADTRHRERRGLGIDVHGTEMPFHRFPCATCGNAHLLMVVTDRATGSKSVAQPETIIG